MTNSKKQAKNVKFQLHHKPTGNRYIAILPLAENDTAMKEYAKSFEDKPDAEELRDAIRGTFCYLAKLYVLTGKLMNTDFRTTNWDISINFVHTAQNVNLDNDNV